MKLSNFTPAQQATLQRVTNTCITEADSSTVLARTLSYQSFLFGTTIESSDDFYDMNNRNEPIKELIRDLGYEMTPFGFVPIQK